MCIIIKSKTAGRWIFLLIFVNVINYQTESTSQRDIHVSHSIPEIPIFSKYCNHINQHGTTLISEKQVEIKRGKKLIALTMCKKE